jgi:hypothetical protein
MTWLERERTRARDNHKLLLSFINIRCNEDKTYSLRNDKVSTAAAERRLHHIYIISLCKEEHQRVGRGEIITIRTDNSAAAQASGDN